MTEDEWNRCTDPQKMLEWLRHSGKAHDRKLRLFAAACCRRIWPLLTDERSRTAVERAEQFADGLVDSQARSMARRAASDATAVAWRAVTNLQKRCDSSSRDKVATFQAAQAATYALDARLAKRTVALGAAEAVCRADKGGAFASTARAVRKERRSQAELLRDLFGPFPFRQVRIEPGWLQGNEGIVRRLAAATHEERTLPQGTLDRDRLAVLADALEEAGCTNEEILSHCRSRNDHVRGCWLLDLLLGKE